MAVEVSDNQNIFRDMEKFDEMQILNPELRDKLCYQITVRGKQRLELSYAGVKQLILEMSQNDQSMEIVSKTVERSKIDDEPTNDIWYAEIILRNKKTGHESWGVSENPVYAYGKYDQFGRTKAVSKAIRNAERQQLPELLISAFLEKSQSSEKIQYLQKNDNEPTQDPEKYCLCEKPIPNALTDGKTCQTCKKLMGAGN